MQPMIALLTDFGLKDPYVGQMKAVCLQHAPGAELVDISHDVAAFNIIQAGFFLAASLPYFREGTVFACVVDPGVGTSRKIALVEQQGRFFLAPDNGLLSLILARDVPTEAYDATPADAPASNTFHGRDIFAVLAARLAMGEAPQEMARPMRPKALVTSDWSRTSRSGGALVTSVLHIDRFGNCILNLPLHAWQETIASWGSAELVHPRRQPLTPGPSYGSLPQGGLGLLEGSQGYYELAVNRGSAARRVGLAIGDLVRLGRG